jgi:hypothetical protein
MHEPISIVKLKLVKSDRVPFCGDLHVCDITDCIFTHNQYVPVSKYMQILECKAANLS